MDWMWLGWKSRNPAIFKSMKKACNEGDASRLMNYLKNINPKWISDCTFDELFGTIMCTHYYVCLEPLLLFVAAFYNISTRDVIDRFSLIIISIEKNRQCAEYIISKLTDPNELLIYNIDTPLSLVWGVQNINTPLSLACSVQNIQVVKLLLKRNVVIKGELWIAITRYLQIKNNVSVFYKILGSARHKVYVAANTRCISKEATIVQLLLMVGERIDQNTGHNVMNVTSEEVTKNVDKIMGFARNCY